MFMIAIIVYLILMVCKFIANHIEFVCWIHYSNEQKRAIVAHYKEIFGEDWEYGFEESRNVLRRIDSELGSRHWNPNEKFDIAKEDIKLSVIKNKSQKLINFWDYYFNIMLCRKDLLNSADPMIRAIYYCRKISTIIEIIVTPQPTAVQFYGLFLQQLEVAAVRTVRLKKIEEEELPESIKKKLEKAA